MVTLHERDKAVHEAATDLRGRVRDWLTSHELTTTEELAVLNHTLGGIIHGTLKLCLRRERTDEQATDQKDSDVPQDGRNGRGGRHRNDQ